MTRAGKQGGTQQRADLRAGTEQPAPFCQQVRLALLARSSPGAGDEGLRAVAERVAHTMSHSSTLTGV